MSGLCLVLHSATVKKCRGPTCSHIPCSTKSCTRSTSCFSSTYTFFINSCCRRCSQHLWWKCTTWGWRFTAKTSCNQQLMLWLCSLVENANARIVVFLLLWRTWGRLPSKIMAFCRLQLMSTLCTSKTYQVTLCQLTLRRSLLDLGQSNLEVSMSEVRR
jgi:hypothetical protein